MMAEEDEAAPRRECRTLLAERARSEIEVTDRADSEHKPKTTLPKDCRQLQVAAFEPAASSRRTASGARR
jgi:hypothetical protein